MASMGRSSVCVSVCVCMLLQGWLSLSRFARYLAGTSAKSDNMRTAWLWLSFFLDLKCLSLALTDFKCFALLADIRCFGLALLWSWFPRLQPCPHIFLISTAVAVLLQFHHFHVFYLSCCHSVLISKYRFFTIICADLLCRCAENSGWYFCFWFESQSWISYSFLFCAADFVATA